VSEPFYVSRSEISKVRGTHRRARLELGTEVEMGVHGPVKTHYRLEAEPSLPLPVDYLVAAAAG
jgi:hypothetical protein